MYRKILLLSFLLIMVGRTQKVIVPDYYQIDENLNQHLQTVVSELGLEGDFDVGEDGIEQISLAVIYQKGDKTFLAGVNPFNFIYPASVYKMYVAAEVLNQISHDRYSLDTKLIVHSPNDVDKYVEIGNDPRPLLSNGDTVTVNYLLDLMITRSDNSAANCLIDLADRKNINALMNQYHWQGSEVTRKFLSRKYEDPGYEKIRGTETCAFHAADFLYLVETNQLVNPWVSMQLKSFLGRQLDNSKLSGGLPTNTMFYHKTGWFSYWTNDVGIIDDGTTKYIIACFVPLREQVALEKYKYLSREIFQIMRQKLSE